MIVGASCRAAAASATAAGWSVHVADLFDDVDLAAVAVATRRIDDYPAGIIAAVSSFPPAPWCYTGAIENHPGVIERVARMRPLAGNPAAILHRVRDPSLLAPLVAAAGLRFPDTHGSAAGIPTDGSFLRKPRASAGGRGIAPWIGAPGPGAGDEGFVWQRRVPGDALSAVMSLSDDGGQVLGLSRQLVGTSWCRAPAFASCGSIRIPSADAPAAVRAQLDALAAALAVEAGLRGIVGVDALLGTDGRLTVIEVNPRPPASAELVERATGTSIMAAHLAAFGTRSPTPAQRGCDTIWSKAILFAATRIAVDGPLLDRLLALAAPWSRADGRPALADIPRPDQVLHTRAPVLTVFARGDTELESVAELRRRIDAVVSVTG